MGIKAKELTVSLPFGIGELTFVSDEIQQKAAWALYVELETRIASQPLDNDYGLLRESLTSLNMIFDITREVLKTAGPEVAQGENSLGSIAIKILNLGLRPFLAKWHPNLKHHEDMRLEGVSQLTHERGWGQDGEEYKGMRLALKDLQNELRIYIDALGEISHIKLKNK